VEGISRLPGAFGFFRAPCGLVVGMIYGAYFVRRFGRTQPRAVGWIVPYGCRRCAGLGAVHLVADRRGHPLHELTRLLDRERSSGRTDAGGSTERMPATLVSAKATVTATDVDYRHFLNVVRGDMSLIGPRPTLRYQVERHTERQRKRLDVLPGLTGWAQIQWPGDAAVGRAHRARRLVRGKTGGWRGDGAD
jgi:hypothetical protein